MLEIKNLIKEYKVGSNKVVALDGVSFSVKPGNLVAIVGPSGCGKTSLLNILGALDSEFSGDVIVNNKSLVQARTKDLDSYRKNTVGFIFQHFSLINSLRSLENVELALDLSNVSKKIKRARAKSLLDKVGLSKHYKNKVNTLSGGQKQRVAIARALANDPEIILADEPTGALDYNTGLQVMDLLKEVAADRIVIMVTHSPELAQKYADVIIEMKDGKVINITTNETKQLIASVEKIETKSKMSLKKAYQLANRNLGLKKVRTFFTALGMSIGILGIGLAFALTGGTEDIVKAQVGAVFPANTIRGGIKDKEKNTIAMKPLSYNQIQDVINTIPSKDQYTSYLYVANSINFMSVSLNVEQLKKQDESKKNPEDSVIAINSFTVVDGLDITYAYGSAPKDSYDVVIPRTLAKKIVDDEKKIKDLVGREFYLMLLDFNNNETSYVKLNISGIALESTMFESLYFKPEFYTKVIDDYISTPKEDLLYSQLLFYTEDAKETKSIVNDWNKVSGDYHFTVPSEGILNMVSSILDSVRLGLVAFSSVSVFVAILKIGIVIFISVLERQREIGIIRAIGGRQKDIRNIFIFESLQIGLFAGLLGVGATYMWTFIINTIINLALNSSGEGLPYLEIARLEPTIAIFLIMICGALSVVSGLIPSLKAARLDPIKAIKSR